MIKQEIREEMLQRRRQLEKEFINKAEEGICRQLFAMESYRSAEVVMLYMNHRHEAPTEKLLIDLLIHEKKFVLPYTDENFNIIPYLVPTHGEENFLNNLKLSKMGILEPDRTLCPEADPKEIDLIIIPGVAFDSCGGRIGFGKGCYDRFLPNLRPEVPKVAFAYDFQITDAFTPDPRDIAMDYIITESRILSSQSS